MPEKNPRVVLSTSLGTITLELLSDVAPVTVDNFVAYVRAGHYDQTIFHRVIPGFMVQGGGFDSAMYQRPTRAPITNEADNGRRNDRGTIAMARTSDPHSATGQFFINVADNDFLNHTERTSAGWGYAVFGRVVEGMEVVDNIVQVPTGRSGPHENVPREPVVIESAVIDE